MLQPHPTIDAIDQLTRPARSARELGYRAPAEFEPTECVWVCTPHNHETWPGCFDLARQQHADWLALMQPYVQVRTTDQLRIATDDSWIRDFGPIFVVKNQAEKPQSKPADDSDATRQSATLSDPAAAAPLACHDFRFNAWGNKYEAQRRLDDLVPQHLANQLNLPIWIHDFVLEGGSIDLNGKGTVMTTEQCLFNASRNPWAGREQIEQTLHDALGTTRVIWLPGGIAGDDTDGHIDDVARFVAPDCVAVVVAPEDHPDHAVTQRNLHALRQARDQDDQPLHIVGLPSPEPIIYDFPDQPSVDQPGPAPVPASYANFLITTDAVFVPVFGQPTDDVACGVLEKVLPHRTIVPVRAEHLVVGLGALHCLSMQQPRV